MCGIAGIYNFSGADINSDILTKMNEVLKHRGPNAGNVYQNGPIGLAHRRLSIIDLSQGHQPMTNEDKSIWIVFNGEIYNFAELRKELEEKKHQFSTHSDTEVIVHAYEEFGVRCVEKFNGMFAFAIWDEKKETLFLARDRIGIKPLYYYVDDHRILFASELKAILEDKSINRKLNYQAVADYFSLGYIPAPGSILTGIYKLEPGHYITIKQSKFLKKEYWDLSFNETQNVSMEAHKSTLLDLLRKAVKRRLVSEVPLGAFLSGGVDSSAIVALMSELQGKGIKTSSIGFKESGFNELEYADEISKRYSTDHYQKILSPDAMEVLDILTWHYDEPFADSSMIPTYYVSKITRENVTVALSGDGGDENFAGYTRYKIEMNTFKARSLIPGLLRRTLVPCLASIYPKADYLPRIFRAKTTLENLAVDHISAYFHSSSIVDTNLLKSVYSESFKRELVDYDPCTLFREYANKADTDHPLSLMQYIDFKTYLPEDILTKVDRASMAVALEARVPILDHEFVEYAASIPPGMKLNGQEQKHIFKESLRQHVPESILFRKKHGFDMPVSEWFRKEMKDYTESVIFDKK